MAKYKPYDYSQSVMLPLSLEEQLVPGTLEYAIHHIIEHRFDISCFNERFSNDKTGVNVWVSKDLGKGYGLKVQYWKTPAEKTRIYVTVFKRY